MSETQGQSRHVNAKEALHFIAWMTVAGIAVVLVQSFQVADTAGVIKQFSIMLALAGASCMMGGLVGFLFGIPRRLQRESAPVNPASAGEAAKQGDARPLYEGNTNLEQISDWLTKLIVGVTLVEFTNIVNQLKLIGDSVAQATGRNGDNAFSIGVILSFFVAGFLLGYLWTRLYLGRALSDAEGLAQIAERLDTFKQEVTGQIDRFTLQARSDADAIAFARRQIDPGSAENATVEDAVKFIGDASHLTRAQVFYLAEENRWRHWKSNKSLLERSIILFEALIKADVDGKYHRNFSQLAYCLKDKSNPDLTRALTLLDEAIRIRDREGDDGWRIYEANRAIVKILLEQSGDRLFAPSQPQRKSILEDIEKACQDEWVRNWFVVDPAVMKWSQDQGYVLPNR
ncbi:hypothetical protein HA461_25850 (plasmid) [Rhizobium leguminosarum bv. trifolii]|uniref:hypothetical protein n=1 Tax=Rhizobium leguminosarum TaxID=384 RepID=UPI00140FF509|nr:hypothetical protein [Rhizobium leguminosarum]QIO54613.1 hypothetical protein HA461_25850 [Rhizobium leguminosarum bv. trifolii]